MGEPPQTLPPKGYIPLESLYKVKHRNCSFQTMRNGKGQFFSLQYVYAKSKMKALIVFYTIQYK
jgi:hypothetical protein